MGYMTEKELQEHYEFYTMQVEDLLIKGEDFTSVAEKSPICMQLSDPKTYQVCWANEKFSELSGYSLEEVEENWDDYIQIVHPETVNNILEFLPEFYATQTRSQTLHFLQYVKLHQQSTYSPVISFTKPSSLSNGMLLWLTALPGDLGKMSKHMEQIVKMDQFKLKHFKRFQQLTAREIEILKLLANGCNNPEIAERIFISRSTVETHRKNIKRKLEIRTYRDMIKYAFAFNLIAF